MSRPASHATTLGMRLRQSAVWAFGASTLALAPAACGGVETVSLDASAEAGAEAAAPDEASSPDAELADAGAADAEADDGLREKDATSRCDVFIGVDYGAAPCQ
jgi:hypothetical protein